MFDQMIEAALPSQRASNDVGSERSIALVIKPLATGVQCSWQVGASASDRANGVIRGNPGRRRHRRLNRSPAEMECPVRNSRTGIGRLPSRCSSRISRSPTPVATRMAFVEMSMIVPGPVCGAASGRAESSTLVRHTIKRSPFK
jgi:hypothetical protein